MRKNHHDDSTIWVYRINGAHDGFSNSMPPQDAYDEGTLQPLHAPATEVWK